ncbi:MAG: exodeoxyribonuclease V subunit gamma [Balneola sp.]
MFYDYRSNSITNLSGKFLELLSNKSPKDPFKGNWIIVQNREMQQWLTLQESARNSISANNKFIFPSEFLWKLYRLKNPELSDILPSDLTPIQWSIFELLKTNKKFRKSLIGEKNVTFKILIQISKSIADVFDLYQVFRPELINGWENNRLKYNHTTEKWQSDLWNSLKSKWNNIPEAKTRVQALKELKSWINNGEYPFTELPENIWLFSIPQISNPFANIVSDLAKRLDCHNFNFSFDSNSGNEEVDLFSQKLTKSARDNDLVFQKHLDENKTETKLIELPNSKRGEDSILNGIQHMLFNDSQLNIPKGLDSSFTIHSCHSIKREIEVLKDSVLEALNSDKKMKAEDVLILVPQTKDYKSHIEHVFSSYDLFLPVNSGYIDQTEFVESTFINLFGILNSDFKVNAVIDLIDNSIISKKWGLDNSDIQLLREWSKDLHIHRFLDSDSFSWRSGLNRLILGSVMESQSINMFNESIPYKKIHSKDNLELVAKLSSFIEELESFSDSISKNNSLKEWLMISRNLVKVFLLNQFDEEYKIPGLISKLELLSKKCELSGFTENIDFETYFIWLKDQFSGKSSSSSGYGHGINVSDYVSNRSIPYKFVAVLGFNESVLPKKVIRPDFDLIHAFPQPGDRILTEEDRFLFFEMIQSAKEKLHISYIGQDQHSQNKKAPSILLQQLLDITSSLGLRIPIEEHKLHGFDESYFDKEEPKSFSKKYEKITRSINVQDHSATTFINSGNYQNENLDLKTISIFDLISFYSHPAKYLCNQIFGIRNSSDFQDLEDREPFKLTGLDSYFLKDFVSDLYFDGIDIDNLKQPADALGLIPKGFPGTLEFHNTRDLISQFEDVKKKYDFLSKVRVEVEEQFKETTIFGSIDRIINDERVVIRLGDLKGKNLIELWLNHLLLNTQFEYLSNIYFIKQKKSVQKLSIYPNQADQNHLLFLADLYKQACLGSDNVFCPVETGFEFAKSLFKENDEEKAIKKALSKWEGNNFFPSEADDFYNQKVFNDSSFIFDASFKKRAQEVWFPILQVVGDSV